MKLISSNVNSILISTFLIVLSGCGGGSGGSNDASPTNTVVETFTGQFLDAKVQGLSYQTASQNGITNAEGEFIYQQGEMITFSIGAINFPEVSTGAIITPLDLYSTDDIYDDSVVNTIRLLQSLDKDGMPDNGIEISEQSHQLFENFTTPISSSNFEAAANDVLAANTEINQSLIAKDQAIYHFQTTIDLINGNEITNCAKTHEKVGYSGSFRTFSHDVSGDAVIIDDCTIAISNFNYDGGGPDVYIYGAIDHDYDGDDAFVMSDMLNGKVYSNESFEVTLPNGKTLDDLTGISVWCADVNVDFGSIEFGP